ncbi:MAG: UDP-N-acetylmuramoyl-L-alanine--D-glutamate ligase [Bacteroidales bacterium]|nr:UDP-N-acetylmuramoyl-L-alanine--D-glutamate ligase [Bacteroidales bacterium]
MKALLKQLLHGRKLLILGFGKEGKSTCRYIRRLFPDMPLSIADIDPKAAKDIPVDFSTEDVTFFTGQNYLDAVADHQLIIKSPGIRIPRDFKTGAGIILTSQTRLMLEAFHRQIIGITGTKGKSTTTSLVHHLLQAAGKKTILAGNIGLPPFDYLEWMTPGTLMVYEMSSHQLEDTVRAPHIAVLLNLYPEHLDRYDSLARYYDAKMRILSGQQDGDIFIYNRDIAEISHRVHQITSTRRFLPFSSQMQVKNGCYLSGNDACCMQNSQIEFCFELNDSFMLKGKHNRMNTMAAILAAKSAGAEYEAIRKGLSSFKGLEHRIEYVGNYRGIDFYNDSIATIPEATMAALDALPDTDTLILGGFDRMLDYDELIGFLAASGVRNFIFLGKAGERMYGLFQSVNQHGKNLIISASLEDAMDNIFKHTLPGKICLLSPAAASYDSFRNFEERGDVFKKQARSH